MEALANIDLVWWLQIEEKELQDLLVQLSVWVHIPQLKFKECFEVGLSNKRQTNEMQVLNFTLN